MRHFWQFFYLHCSILSRLFLVKRRNVQQINESNEKIVICFKPVRVDYQLYSSFNPELEHEGGSGTGYLKQCRNSTKGWEPALLTEWFWVTTLCPRVHVPVKPRWTHFDLNSYNGWNKCTMSISVILKVYLGVNDTVIHYQMKSSATQPGIRICMCTDNVMHLSIHIYVST